MAFLDQAKALNSINWQALSKILKKYGCLEKLITTIRLLYDDAQATALSKGQVTKFFCLRTAVKQGCVLAPALFSVFLTTALRVMTIKLPAGVQLSTEWKEA